MSQIQYFNCTKTDFIHKLEKIVSKYEGFHFGIWLKYSNNSFTIISSNKFGAKKGFPTKYVGKINETPNGIEINGRFRISLISKMVFSILLFGVLISLIAGKNIIIYDFENSWPVLVVFVIGVAVVELLQRNAILKVLNQIVTELNPKSF